MPCGTGTTGDAPGAVLFLEFGADIIVYLKGNVMRFHELAEWQRRVGRINALLLEGLGWLSVVVDVPSQEADVDIQSRNGQGDQRVGQVLVTHEARYPERRRNSPNKA